MTYQVLARKWRPQGFSGLIGQQPIVTALRNALQEGRLAQAYLFSGIRGVGKTTAARIFAKALNCEKGPAPDPCNACGPCTEITAGADVDVIEVDAATYSKVEQIRELAEGLRYGPARDRYKVAVLDEVHRLSRQAFDALLKIVEEPPAHLVFIFATTEIDTVPATLLSRCHEFHFRRVPSAVLAAHLRTLCDAEGIEASDVALRLIARAGEGSVRDAVALLDQLATFGGNTINDRDARDLAGGLDAAIFRRLLAAQLAGSPEGVIGVVSEVETQGWEPHGVFAQYLSFCRDALHLAAGAPEESLDLPADDARELAELVAGARYEDLLRLLHLELASEASVRRGEVALLALEVAWLRGAELPKLTRVETLLSAAPTTPPAAGTGRGEGTATSSSSADRASTEPLASDSMPPSEAAAAPASTIASFLERLSSRKRSLAAHLSPEMLVYADDLLGISPRAGDALLPQALERPGNREILSTVVREVFGRDARWELQPPEPSPAPAQPPLEPVVESAPQHRTVQAVLEIFDGTIQSVQPPGENPQP